MKLLLILFSFSAMAGYIHTSEVEKLGRTFFFKKKHCVAKFGPGCIKAKPSHNPETDKLVNGKIVTDSAKKASYKAVKASKKAAKKAKKIRWNNAKVIVDAIDCDTVVGIDKNFCILAQGK